MEGRAGNAGNAGRAAQAAATRLRRLSSGMRIDLGRFREVCTPAAGGGEGDGDGDADDSAALTEAPAACAARGLARRL